ncbi:hypothetical protein MNQ98_11965 [Paenibacillus sp. N3/727]|uniref:hypothetical protein n=1 Tax=Paenibacillus sp. N3/727 TaxID=2925845 RepID=UPI001F5357A6|nr:hypothetical protein [Paenibacillus sp. N3/727]UNK20677.1 hypothetical protein MNQ98_11965 [Paenibacillus sp. N3/727]
MRRRLRKRTKKLLLKEFIIALATNDINYIFENITDHVIWNVVGDQVIQGKAHLTKTLRHMNKLITHGRNGAVSGTFITDMNKRYAFCQVYTFSSAAKNAKIKEITSYIIEES